MMCATPYIDGVDWPTPEQMQPMTELEKAQASAHMSWLLSSPERPYEHMSLDHLSVFAAHIEKGLHEAYADGDLMEIEHLGRVLDELVMEIAKRVF
jgi:hypothetical protein